MMQARLYGFRSDDFAMKKQHCDVDLEAVTGLDLQKNYFSSCKVAE